MEIPAGYYTLGKDDYYQAGDYYLTYEHYDSSNINVWCPLKSNYDCLKCGSFPSYTFIRQRVKDIKPIKSINPRKPLTLEERQNKVKIKSKAFVSKYIKSAKQEDFDRFEQSFLAELDPNKIEYNLPSNFEEYCVGQQESGLKVGDTVIVTDICEDGKKYGWGIGWASEMSHYLGKKCKIKYINVQGIKLDNDWVFPYFVLEKVE